MKPYFDLGAIRNGRIAIMPHPEAGHLDAGLRRLKRDGVTCLVSLQEPEEAAACGLDREAEACKRCGIGFARFPIPDFGLPEPEVLERCLRHIERWADAGESIAVHCRAGIGRSGLVAACLLVRNGFDPAAALDHVSLIRGRTVPETVEQRELVFGYRS